MAEYEKDAVVAPVVAGWKLRTFVRALESSITGPRLRAKLLHDSGIARWRALPAADATPTAPLLHRMVAVANDATSVPPPIEPLPPAPHVARALPVITAALEAAPSLVAPASVAPPGAEGLTTSQLLAYFRANPEGPIAVAERALAALTDAARATQAPGWIIAHHPDEVRAAAAASAARWKAGSPRSVLDGMPVVVKDELDVAGYATTLGTRFRTSPATVDATVVARLRAAGAIVLAKANMNEIGINPIGLNPHWGPARNPWNPAHITGGSSSGSAGAVAGGLCAIAIGADGGGSIRIPAALCGVVGLKATYGRIPETGIPPLCWHVGHVGPIGQTVADVAVAYAVMAGPCAGDASSLQQPGLTVADVAPADISGLRVGVCWPYLEDATPAIVDGCKRALALLRERGAQVVELPPPDLNTLKWTHAVLILSEMATAMASEVATDVRRFALDSRTNLALAQAFTAQDYVHALRHRQRLTHELLAQFDEVDVMLTPTTGITAPRIPEYALPDGESNLPVVDALMRFARLGNLTGFPALAVPTGLDAQGLPTSVQLTARPFAEALLLRVGAVVETLRARARPTVWTDLLQA